MRSPVFLLSLAEDDRDVAQPLLDARRATHRAGAPAAQVLVGRLVDEGGLDVERVEVDPGIAGLRIGDGALDELLDDRSGGLAREFEHLKRFAGLTAADEIHDDPRFARTDPRKPRDCLADHGLCPVATVVPIRFEPNPTW